MTDLAQRIVASARSHIGTRFRHQGRRKAQGADMGGLDCLGLLVSVASECELMRGGYLLASRDERDYGHIPDAARLRRALEAYMRPIAVKDAAAGDVLLLAMDHNPQHVAIVAHIGDALSLIHAYAPARRVVEHRMDASWQQRICAAFRFDETED